MTEINGSPPISKVSPERSPEERNIRKQLGNVRRSLAQSTNSNFKKWWESQIIVYEKQLVKANARACFR